MTTIAQSISMNSLISDTASISSGVTLGYSTITTSSMNSQRKLFGIGELMKAVEEDRRMETVVTDENQVKAAISGGWELISTDNVEEFLKRRQQLEIFNLSFRCAQQFFEFRENDKICMYQKLQGHEFHRRVLKFSEPTRSGHRFWITYICGNAIKTVIIHDSNNDDVEKLKSFVDDQGRLRIVNERHFISCERVYRRIEETELEKIKRKNEELKSIIAAHLKPKVMDFHIEYSSLIGMKPKDADSFLKSTLQAGDEILQVNGRDYRKMSAEETLSSMKRYKKITLLIRRMVTRQ